MKTITFDETKWKLVPVEPSLSLLDAGWGICGGDGHAPAQPNRQKINAATANYSALLAATPAAPSQPAVPMSESQRADMICAVAAICTGTSARTIAATAIEWAERYYGIATAPSQEPVNRPQNCGTSYCSCIECVCEPSQPVTLTDRQFDLICQAIDKADTITMEGDYMMDSGDCIAVVRVMQALFSIAALREK